MYCVDGSPMGTVHIGMVGALNLGVTSDNMELKKCAHIMCASLKRVMSLMGR